MNAEGVTVLLTTHYLQEAEAMCDTIAIINDGRLIACESTRELLARLDTKEMQITIDVNLEVVPVGLNAFNSVIIGERRLTHRVV